MNIQSKFLAPRKNQPAHILLLALVLLMLAASAHAGSPPHVVWERALGERTTGAGTLLGAFKTTSGGLLIARTHADRAGGPLQPLREWCHVHVFNASGEETTNTLMGHFRDPFSYYSAGNAVAMMDTRDGGYFYVDNYVWPDYNFALQETYKEIIQKFDGAFNLQWHYVNPPDFGQWKRADYIHDLLEPTSGTCVAVGNLGQTRPGPNPTNPIFEDFVYVFCAKNGTPTWYRTFLVGTQTQMPPLGDLLPGRSEKRHSLAPAPNGDFYAAGYTCAPSNSYVARLSDKGEERWLVRPKPTGCSLRWLKNPSESEILVAGDSQYTTGTKGAWAAVYREDGSMAWSREYPQIKPLAFDSYADGGFVLAGSVPHPRDYDRISSYPLIVRMDREGREIWRREISSEDFYRFNGCVGLPDGGCIVVGPDSPENIHFASVLCLDDQGQVRWKRKFGQQFMGASFQGVHRFPNGEILLIGDMGYKPASEGGIAEMHVYLVKLAAERAAGKVWERYADAREEPGANSAAQGPPSGSGGPAGGGGPRNPLVWIASLAGGGAVLLIVIVCAARVRRAGKSGPRLAPPVL